MKMKLMLFMAVALGATDKEMFEQRKESYRRINNVDELQDTIDRLKQSNEESNISILTFKEKADPRIKQKRTLEQKINAKINSCPGIKELKAELRKRSAPREKLAAIAKESIIKNGREALTTREKLYDLSDADREIESIEKKINKLEAQCPDLSSLKNQLRNLSIEIERDEARTRDFLKNINENEELIEFLKSRMVELKNRPKNEVASEKTQTPVAPRRESPKTKKTLLQRAQDEANKAMRVFQKKQ